MRFARLTPAAAAIVMALTGSLATAGLISSRAGDQESLDLSTTTNRSLEDSMGHEWRITAVSPGRFGTVRETFVESEAGIEHRVLLVRPEGTDLENDPGEPGSLGEASQMVQELEDIGTMAPDDGGPTARPYSLELRLSLDDSRGELVRANDARAVDLRDRDGRLLFRYGLVSVIDANGKEVAAQIDLTSSNEDSSPGSRNHDGVGEGALGGPTSASEPVRGATPTPRTRRLRLRLESQDATYPIRIVLLARPDDWKETWANDVVAREAFDTPTTLLADSEDPGGGLDRDPSEPRPESLFGGPSNDNCSGAIIIPNGSFPVRTTSINLIDATTTGDPVFCATTDRTAWYKFTAPSTGTYIITSCASAGATGTDMPDTVLAVYSAAGGCAAPGASLVCNDDDVTCTSGVPSGRQSTVSASLTSGATYFIVVGRYAGVGAPPPQSAFVQLQISQMLPPANDSCSGQIPALSLDSPLEGTTFLAVNDFQLSPAAPTCLTLPSPPAPVGNNATSAAGRDVVYSFRAPSAGSYSFRVTGYSTAQNAVLYAVGSCPAGVPPVIVGNPPCLGAANRNATSGAEEVMCLPLTANQLIFLVVDDSVSGNAGSLFRIEANRCTRETEPNGTTSNADPFACPVEGSIDPASDVDFFSFGSAAIGSRLFVLLDGVAANELDSVLRVTTTVDTLEFDDDDNDAPWGRLSPNIAGVAVTAAAPFVRLNAFRTDITGEPYRLYKILQPPSSSAIAESEPNNTVPNADAAGADYFSGTLSGPAPSTDIDIYKFAAREGTLISLNLDGDPPRNGTPIDAALDLLDETGKVLVAANDRSTSESTASGAGSLTASTPFSPGEGLIFRTPFAGTFYARVSIGTTSTSSTGAGDYLLSIGLNCLTSDLDGDGVADAADCAPSNSILWSAPTVVTNLHLSGNLPTSLNWIPASGGLPMNYDVLRSTTPSDFSVAHAVCVESDGTNVSASDNTARPATGTAYFYLVRAENACGSNMGTSSAGLPRVGRSCP